MKRHSFFSRLFLGNLLLVAILAAVTCGVSYVFLNAEYRAKNERHQDRLTRVLQHHFQATWPAPELEGKKAHRQQLDRACKEIVRDMPARLTVIAPDGEVLGDSDADPDRMVNHKTPDRPEVLAALKGRAGRDIRPSETLGIEFRYLARPVVKDGKIRGLVRVAMPVIAIAESEKFIPRALLWAALAAVFVAVALGLLLSWIWYAPLRQITQTAGQIASGDLSPRAPTRGSRELARLGTALNEMRQSLARQIQTIDAQRDSLAGVIANLREGVIALDRAGHIVLMNESARRMLAPGAEDVVGRHVQSVVRVPEVVDALDELADDGPVQKQMDVDLRSKRRTLDVHASRIAGHGCDGISALLVVRDITELARTAAVKAEFVANASHELRTPLATIRAAVDSLSAVDPGDEAAIEKVAAILDRSVKRLEDMTNDLLDLHFVEQVRSKLRLEDLQLGSLAEWANAQFAAQAEQRGVRFAAKTGEPACRFRSDRRLVKLILQNLIDNGIKFTPAGGSVECVLKPWDSGIQASVADTGCGIPPEMQERVFERFFQADPSRARRDESRGTGLGLAIVKYAAERLGAEVDLESRVGRGTTVKVFLPVPPKR